MKKCPYCAEEIQDAAIVCRYCGRDLTKTAPRQQPVPKTAKPPAKKQPRLLLGAFIIFLICCGLLRVIGTSGTSTPTSEPADEAVGGRSVVTATMTSAPTDTSEPTLTQTPTVTPEPATQTAYAINQTATKKAENATATKQAASINSTGTSQAKSDYATRVALYTKINAQELVTYPNNHISELVVVRGRVFNINSDKEFQIWIDGASNEAVYIVMSEPYDDIFENNHVTIYGVVYGEKCGTNAFGGEVCQAVILGNFYEMK